MGRDIRIGYDSNCNGGNSVTDFKHYEIAIGGYTVRMRSEDELTTAEQHSISTAAMDRRIYFDDRECRSWFFDFKHDGRWVGSIGIDVNEMTIRVDAREEERHRATGILEGRRPIADPEDENGAWESAAEEKRSHIDY